jgi:hypothetical protein
MRDGFGAGVESVHVSALPYEHTKDKFSGKPPSFDIPSNKYADIFGLWPPELFDGFDEFVLKCRRESGFGREPPPWW